MSFQLEYFGMVEGVAHDSRSAITLVGVNQNVIVTASLPYVGYRSFVVFAYDFEREQLSPGTMVEVNFRILTPSGNVLMGQSNSAPLPEAPEGAPDVPGTGMQMIFGVQLNLNEYGEYKAELSLTLPKDTVVKSVRRFWLINAQEALLPKKP